MKNLLLSSILVLVFTGCTLSKYNSFHRTTENVIEQSSIVPWFQGDPDHFLFHANIDISSNHFGGIMVIKVFTGDSYRIVYVSEIGIKIFDMEFFKNGDFKLHYCLDVLNKKPVIKTLKSDIGIMFESIPEKNKIKIWNNSEESKTLIRSKDRSGIWYYILNNSTNKIEEVSHNNCLRKKTNLFFYSENGIELDSIRIKDYRIKLNIQLSKLNETKSYVP